MPRPTAEDRRLAEEASRRANWKRWGPYLPERQWATVREDYSPDGRCWDYLTHDQARSRAYRWGEDGILGFSDRECRLCLAPTLWNGRDAILKERLFGLDGNQGNHGEDAKECWWHLDATPTGSYCAGRYRYPLAAFPYRELVDENRRRGREAPEYELEDTGVFADDRFVDVDVEYAKAAPEDLCWRLTVRNRSRDEALIHLLPTIWFRNTWIWGCRHEGCGVKPWLRLREDRSVSSWHESLGRFTLTCDGAPEWLFTDNHTNHAHLFGTANDTPYVKDAFHRRLIDGDLSATNPKQIGTKAAAWHRLRIPAGGAAVVRLRLRPSDLGPGALGRGFDRVIATRRAEADAFYAGVLGLPRRAVRAQAARDVIPQEPPGAVVAGNERGERLRLARLAYAGLLWSRKFYHYIVRDWLSGDPEQPPPPREREHGRNKDWGHLYNRDIISLPDAWEYPWYASWDLAFHAVAFTRVDPGFAQGQLELFLREWYLHPNGQIPAYEFALGDVNPPVHAWAAWRVYRAGQTAGKPDLAFLERVFHKLLLNFTWWVNRKDPEGNNLFAGGFLGLDNIGLFDRSQPPPGVGLLQADGTAWMAFYAGRMLTIAIELARHRRVYEDIASKFLEHFVAIADAMNAFAGHGLWHDEDGFYYDHLRLADGSSMPLRVRSLVGAVPLFASAIISAEALDALPGFAKRLAWFRRHRGDLAAHNALLQPGRDGRLLLAIPTRDRLERVVQRLLDEDEFLSPHGVRSLSRAYARAPYVLDAGGSEYRIAYTPAESTTGMFGGNSNWRGPVWFPLNILLIEALERYHGFYGDDLMVELPTGSGRRANLKQAAADIGERLTRLFLPDAETGQRPCLTRPGGPRSAAPAPAAPAPDHPLWRDLVSFHEYFDGDTGRGCGAAHQTGWTALAAPLLEGRRLRASS